MSEISDRARALADQQEILTAIFGEENTVGPLLIELAEAAEERDELQALFDKQYERMMEAIRIWQAEDPANRNLTWPDLGAMITWFLEKHGESSTPDPATRPPTPFPPLSSDRGGLQHDNRRRAES